MIIKDKEEEKSFSFTWAAFAGILTAAVMFGLLFEQLVVPMNEDTNARIQAITFNESQFQDLKNDFKNLEKEFTKLQNVTTKDVQLIENKTNLLWKNKGEWECTEWKQYDNLDCVIATKQRNASIIENTTICRWFNDDKSGTYTFPMICEDEEYVREGE